MDYKIIYEYDTERNEDEAEWKGFRSDVVVEINDKLLNVYITTAVRLMQDATTEIDENGYYESIPNTIIVDNVTKDRIEYTIKKLVERGYFDKIN